MKNDNKRGKDLNIFYFPNDISAVYIIYSLKDKKIPIYRRKLKFMG